MRPLAILDTPLDTLTLVEASAGTGKTYAIAGLYLRLVVETGIPVPAILVVTYTRAATEELRGRIRQRLVDLRQCLQHAKSDEPLLRELLARLDDDTLREQARRRLEAALLAFDEAAIYTIHGFCQRVLADTAFASAMPLSTELVAEEGELLREIVEDFWRRRLFAARPSLLRQILEAKWTPDTLQRLIQPLLGKPYLHLVDLDEAPDLDVLEREFEAAFQAARDCWFAGREAIVQVLSEATGLSKTSYKPANFPAWFAAMDAYLEGGDEGPDPKLWDKFTHFTRAKLEKSTNKGKTTPEHPFFDLCQTLNEAAGRLREGFRNYLLMLRRDLFLECQEKLPRLKRKYKVQSYDDLLVNLHRALHDAHGGAQLGQQLRTRYRAALIDEFQDTDPVQYEIFRTLYADGEHPAFLVGDPKQAIYSFRGADIFAYLQARGAVNAAYTLDTNHRATPALVEAVNAVFGQHQLPFLLDGITFQPVRAAQRERPVLHLPDGAQAPLRFWFQPPREDGKVHSKDGMGKAAVAAVAGRIARILNLAVGGEARLGKRPLQGGDMAVLVRTNRQALQVREALLARGVASVLHSRDSVFDTPEAGELERLLAALVQPRREVLVRGALLTDCLGLDLTQVEALGRSDSAWEALLQRFAGYHQQWREQGFMRMFRRLLQTEGVYARLLAHPDGERRLTNLLHLAELAQTASLDQRLGQEGLLAWLAAQRQQPTVDEDSRQLRLESDAQLVQIVTIHKAKGLEYPIVFCPFLWDGGFWSQKDEIVRCHDPQDQGRAVLDLGSSQLERRRQVAIHEEMAEQLRLAYVALTRARYRCYVVCGAVSKLAESALGWLLHPPPVIGPGVDPLEAQAQFLKSVDGAGLRAGLERLLEAAPDAVAVEDLPEEGERHRPPDTPGERLRPREFAGTPPLGWCFSSFSALQHRAGGGVADHDPGAGLTPGDLSIHGFPRGTRAGRCLHALLERLDFIEPVRGQRALVAEQLARHGFEADWTGVLVAALQRMLETPLPGEPAWRLGEVVGTGRLNELAFVYRMDRLGLEDLRGLLADHGMDPALLGNLDFSPLRGFMRGVVDLVCRVDGRFQLLDYKSNWLGPGLEDYHPQALARAMLAGGYHLQYLIYTVALHRYLGWRVPGYDYAEHFGGVHYLFLRGMDGATPGAGVYHCCPPSSLIRALDRYLIVERR